MAWMVGVWASNKTGLVIYGRQCELYVQLLSV